MRLELGSSVVEAGHPGDWERKGMRREDCMAGSRSVSGSGLYKRMGVMGWK